MKMKFRKENFKWFSWKSVRETLRSIGVVFFTLTFWWIVYPFADLSRFSEKDQKEFYELWKVDCVLAGVIAIFIGLVVTVG